MFADIASCSRVASIAASSSALCSATIAVAPTITRTSATKGVKMKIRIGRPSRRGSARSRATLRPDSHVHSLLPIARSLTRPGISAQNHPNRLASGRATRKASGPHDPGDRRREQQRRRDPVIRNPRGELIRTHIAPQHRLQRSGTGQRAARYRHHVLAIRKSGFLPRNWWAIQKTRGIDEISRQPREQEFRRDALDQV